MIFATPPIVVAPRTLHRGLKTSEGPPRRAGALLGYAPWGDTVRTFVNPPPAFAFLTAEPTLDPLAAAADLLDRLLYSARGLLCLLRRVAHLVILPTGDPRSVLLATASGFLLCLCHPAIPPVASGQRVMMCRVPVLPPERFSSGQFESVLSGVHYA
jgi:hypothetical protein